MSSVTTFNRALARSPASSAVDGLRSVDRGPPDLDRLSAEHAAYVKALKRRGVAVEVLGPLEAFPDSLFVEDPALVFPEGAILLRPGAPTRLGESETVAPEIAARFGRVIALEPPGYADGGDVMVTAGAVFIGLSARTDRTGAAALADALRAFGRNPVVVEPPPGVLHLKTASSPLGDDTVLATRAMADAGLFSDLEVIVVPDGEEAAANALAVNGTVLLAAGFPRTADLLQAHGYTVETLRLDEVMKLDAGLSCMSLRWYDPALAA